MYSSPWQATGDSTKLSLKNYYYRYRIRSFIKPIEKNTNNRKIYLKKINYLPIFILESNRLRRRENYV